MLNGAPVGDEILVMVFAHWLEPKLHVTEARIVRAFYALSKRKEHQDILRNYSFDDDGMEPQCEALSSGLSAMGHSGLLSWDMDFRELTLDQASLRKRSAMIFGMTGEPISTLQVLSFTAAFRLELATGDR